MLIGYIGMFIVVRVFPSLQAVVFKAASFFIPCSYTRRVKKDRSFAIKILLFILQHFKHCPLQISLLYWRYTIPNLSYIVGMLPGTHFL
jgi:hypothetical protein